MQRYFINVIWADLSCRTAYVEQILVFVRTVMTAFKRKIQALFEIYILVTLCTVNFKVVHSVTRKYFASCV
jgi:hypothetical protein